MQCHYRNAIQMLVVFGCLLSPLALADAAKAAAYLDEIQSTMSYPGVSAAIAVEGTTVWSDGSGLADIAAGTQAEPGTVYRLGSVSKMVTIAAVARLVQEGKLLGKQNFDLRHAIALLDAFRE